MTAPRLPLASSRMSWHGAAAAQGARAVRTKGRKASSKERTHG